MSNDSQPATIDELFYQFGISSSNPLRAPMTPLGARGPETNVFEGKYREAAGGLLSITNIGRSDT